MQWCISIPLMYKILKYITEILWIIEMNRAIAFS